MNRNTSLFHFSPFLLVITFLAAPQFLPFPFLQILPQDLQPLSQEAPAQEYALLNITRIEGMAPDFSNLQVQVEAENKTSEAEFTIVSFEPSGWALLNATVPTGDYSLSVYVSNAVNLSAPEAYGGLKGESNESSGSAQNQTPQNGKQNEATQGRKTDARGQIPKNGNENALESADAVVAEKNSNGNNGKGNAIENANASATEKNENKNSAGENASARPENGNSGEKENSAVQPANETANWQNESVILQNSSGEKNATAQIVDENSREEDSAAVQPENGSLAENGNATIPPGNLSVAEQNLSGFIPLQGIPPQSSLSDRLNVTYFPELEQDFSNLLIQFVSANGSTENISHQLLQLVPLEWALVQLSRSPNENETASILSLAKQSPVPVPHRRIAKKERSSLLASPSGKILEIGDGALGRLGQGGTVRVIVKSKSGLQAKALQGVAGRQKLLSKPSLPRGIEVLEITGDSLGALAEMGAEKIYEDLPMSVSLAETMPLIGADRVQTGLNFTGEGITICLLDTGVDFSLPSLNGKAVPGFDFVNGDTDASDDNGHGTKMASIMHAVAPNATILAVKVLDSTGTGYSSDIISGIGYCRSLAAGGAIKIISASFGGGSFGGYCDGADPVAEEASLASSEGLFFSASTGNAGSGNITSPACAQGATAVASTSKQDAISPFSNMNALVDLLAPGEGVIVNGATLPPGTSLSAAHVSGAAALLLQGNSSMAPADAEWRFKTTGKPIEFSGANYTRIDAYNAIINNFTGYPTNQTANQSNQTGNHSFVSLACSNPSACNVALDTAGCTYNLTASISGTNLNCFNVTAANVVLNCNGYTITGSNATNRYGVYSNQANTTVKNCNFKSWVAAVYLNSSASGANVSNNTISSATGASANPGTSVYGVYSAGAGNAIHNNTVSSIVGGACTGGSCTAGAAYGVFSSGAGTSATNNILSTIRAGTSTSVRTGAGGAAYGISFTAAGNASGNTISSILGGSGSNSTVITWLGGAGGAAYGISSTASANLSSNTISSVLAGNGGNGASGDAVDFSGANGGAGGAAYGAFLSASSSSITGSSFSAMTGGNGGRGGAGAGLGAGNGGAGGAAYGAYFSSSSANTIANSTWSAATAGNGGTGGDDIDAGGGAGGNGGSAYSFYFTGSASSSVVNNTLGSLTSGNGGAGGSVGGVSGAKGANNSVLLTGASGSNTFYWNNFTNTSGAYLNDTNGSNYYNSSASGSNEGNIWFNVQNLSVNITGSSISTGFPSLYIGTNGSGHPYSNSTSQSKFSCNFAGCADNKPLTPTQTPAASSCGTLSTAGSTTTLTSNLSISGATCYNITAANVTLNCNGYTITGNNSTGTAYGAYSNSFNTTVKNCIIQSFLTGIYFNSSANNSLISNTTIKSATAPACSGEGCNGTSVFGAYVLSSNNNITNSTITLLSASSGNSSNAINAGTGGNASAFHFSSSSNNTLSNLAISSLTGGAGGDSASATAGAGGHSFGLFFSSSGSNTISSISASTLTAGIGGTDGGDGADGGTAAAVYSSSSSNNAITSMSASGLVGGSGGPNGGIESGAYFTGGQNNSVNCLGSAVSGSNTVGVNGYGFYSSEFNTTIQNCSISNFPLYGILFDSGSANGTVRNNTALVSSSGGTAFYTIGANHTIANNIGNASSSGNAFSIGSSSTTVANNTGVANTGTAFYVLASSSTFTNNTGNSTSGYGFFLSSATDNTFTSNNATSVSSYGIYITSNSHRNTLNSTVGINSNFSIYMDGGRNNTIDCKGVSFAGKNGSNTYGIYTTQNNTTIKNCVISNFTNAIRLNGASGSQVINNTLSPDTANSNTLLTVTGSSSGNTFYWNNFTNTSGYYVNDTNGSNFYNSSASGSNEGNIWFNVQNRSVSISGTSVSTGFPSLLIGTTGAGHPYSNSTSSKIIGNVVDNRPLVTPISCGNNLNIAGYTYAMASNSSISGATCFDITAANVTLNCNGYTVTGSAAAGKYGAYSNSLNTTVKNCIFRNWTAAIFFDTGANISTSNNNTISDVAPSAANPGTPVYGIIANSISNTVNNTTITNLTAGAGSSSGNAGGAAYGIFLNTTSRNNTVSGDTVSSITGGAGAAGATAGAGGAGGAAYGIYLSTANNTLSSFTGSTLAGGTGGTGGAYSNPTPGGTGGTGGGAYGAYFDTSSATGNSLSSTTISSIAGGTGGTGGISTGGGGTQAGNGGTGGRAAVFYSVSASGNNLASVSFATSAGGAGGTGGGGTGGGQTCGNGGAGGSAYSLFFNSSSSTNISASNLSNSTFGIGGVKGSSCSGGSNGANGTDTVVYFLTSNSNTLANSSITANSTFPLALNNSNSSTIYNNTLTSTPKTQNLLTILSTSNSNTFYWNNFTNTSGYYVNDTNGSNYYNSSASGSNEGNIWFNVQNLSVVITGTSASSGFAGQYIGSAGAGYPYNNSTSQSKFSCNFAGCADNRPLTPTQASSNTAPSIFAISAVPASPTVENNISCNITVRDPEQSTTNITYEWYKNGANQTSLAGTYNNLANNTATLISNLTSGNLSVGEDWSCRARAYDGTDYSSWDMSSNITIADSPSVTSCRNLTTAGTTYTLQNSVSISGANCFNVTAANITLNCAGYSVTGNNTTNTYGVYSNQLNTTVRNCIIQNFTAAIYFNSSHNGTIYNDTLKLNQFGIYLANSSYSNISISNITSNWGSGIFINSTSASNSLSNNSLCSNTLDINNTNSSNTGSINKCERFSSWSENSRLGCTFSCSTLWHRIFGNVSGQYILGDSALSPYVYSWSATGSVNVYLTDYDASVSWSQLQAISRNTTNGTVSGDFIELDAALGTSAFSDNITASYSSDGSTPLQTDNYTVFGRQVNDVPVTSSFVYNTTFKTGLLWDMSGGGTTYSNVTKQNVIWATKVNNTALSEAFGTYQYISGIPYTLSTYQSGNDVVAIYAELQ